MGVCHVTIGAVMCPDGGTGMIEGPNPYAAEDITTSGTHAVSTIAVPANAQNLVWSITTDTDVWLKFGAAPEAKPGEDHLVLANTTRFFGAVAGQKVSVEDTA